MKKNLRSKPLSACTEWSWDPNARLVQLRGQSHSINTAGLQGRAQPRWTGCTSPRSDREEPRKASGCLGEPALARSVHCPAVGTPPLSPQADITTFTHRNVLLPTDSSLSSCFAPAALPLLQKSRRGSLHNSFSSQKSDGEQGRRERCTMPRQVMPGRRSPPWTLALSPAGLGPCLEARLSSRALHQKVTLTES